MLTFCSQVYLFLYCVRHVEFRERMGSTIIITVIAKPSSPISRNLRLSRGEACDVQVTLCLRAGYRSFVRRSFIFMTGDIDKV